MHPTSVVAAETPRDLHDGCYRPAGVRGGQIRKCVNSRLKFPYCAGRNFPSPKVVVDDFRPSIHHEDIR
jgi:hypothetical protein